MSSIVVIPNHLPHLDFLNEWEQLKDTKLIVVQDIGKKPKIPEGFDITIYDHKDIEKDLGDNAWIIPSQTSACRSYGYYKAWQEKPDYIYTLDNDCYPDGTDFLKGHEQMLQTKVELGWFHTLDSMYTRGFPYTIRKQDEIWLNHGLWSNIPDLDGPTMLHYPDFRTKPELTSKVIPKDNFFTMCGMNLAWKTELTPAMYFGLFGPEYGFDQYDDIWAGFLVKKVMDHLNLGVRSGYPSIEHRKQSNAFTNTRKQAPGLAMNEHFWQVIRDINLHEKTVVNAYEELIYRLPDVIQDEPEGYTKKFKQAASIWVNLFR